MSLLFYRRPDYLSRSRVRPELDEALCASYVEAAEISRATIPASLSFEEIVKKNTLPPCSLNDFMDYLMYVEYNAECLQFFLWYCGYVERWSKLSLEERSLSPMWHDSKHRPTKRSHSRTSSFAEKTERFNQILAILEKSPKHDGRSSKSVGRKSQRNDSVSKNFSWPRASSAELRHWDKEKDDRPNSSESPAQPFRTEISSVVGHYIATAGPRQLNLTHQARTACFQAIEQTTHPSALLPAFAAVEAILRGQCHPNFVRWSVSNSNRPRVVFVRGLGSTLVLLGFILDVVLILSTISQWIRLLVTPLWILGFAFLIGSQQGICIILHWNYKRNLRPWEQFADDVLANKAGVEQKSDGHNVEKHGHKRKDTGSSTSSDDDAVTLHKNNLWKLGPANTFDTEPWVGLYHQKSVWKRVFDVSVMTQNRHVRAMRDRVVFKSVLWASLGALVLAVCSVFVPSPGLF
ncbi:hypothetical protein SUNI508_03498 [Seiridium unicorne]|uniref:RGS domain-containing protein n=1 Tax=Seiridium unicorne TaxID=138068 RepID=A0ABR2VCH2_9PEZI